MRELSPLKDVLLPTPISNKKKGLIKESVDPRKKAIEIFGMLEGLKTLMYYGASLSEVRQVWTSFANNLLKEIKSSLI